MAITNARQAEVTEKIYGQLVKAGVKLTASLPDDWVNNLIPRVEKGNEIRDHRSLCRRLLRWRPRGCDLR